VPRSQFIFYLLPAVPFMCLGVTAIVRSLPDRWARATGIVVAVASVVCALAFLPVWTGWSVPAGWLHDLAWLPDWPM
jgi:TRAP-type C4-dicarboxylate transport system permease small subunit